MPEMSEYWGFIAAPYLSMIVFPILVALCLYMARSYVTKL